MFLTMQGTILVLLEKFILLCQGSLLFCNVKE